MIIVYCIAEVPQELQPQLDLLVPNLASQLDRTSLASERMMLGEEHFEGGEQVDDRSLKTHHSKGVISKNYSGDPWSDNFQSK